MQNQLIERIKKYKEVLSEVDVSSYEETVRYFEERGNPENEIGIWEQVASAYKEIAENRKDLDLEKKKDIYALLLMLTMGLNYSSGVRNLTPKERDEIGEVFRRTVWPEMQRLKPGKNP